MHIVLHTLPYRTVPLLYLLLLNITKEKENIRQHSTVALPTVGVSFLNFCVQYLLISLSLSIYIILKFSEKIKLFILLTTDFLCPFHLL